LLVACGASQRDRTIKAAMTGLSVTGDSFVEIDRAIQADIVATSSSHEEGLQRLAAYKQKRTVVVDLALAAYRALALAAIVSDDDVSISAAIDAAKKLKLAIEALQKEAKP
jgi:hypothetical protein